MKRFIQDPPAPRWRRIHAVLSAALLAGAGCGAPADQLASPAGPTVPSFASGGTVQYSAKRLPRLLGSYNAFAYDINDAGVIVGGSNVGNILGRLRAVKWEHGVVVDLGVPGDWHQVPGEPHASFVQSIAWGIAPHGVIVGSWRKQFGGQGVPERRGAFRWTAAGVFDSLRGLDSVHALSTQFTEAFAINSQGTAVGYSMNAVQQEHAVKWSASGVLIDINPPWASSSRATDINEEGWVSGSAVNKQKDTVAVAWTPGGSALPLGPVTIPNNAAFGLNDSVQVVGIEFKPQTSGFNWADRWAVFWPPPASGSGSVISPCGRSTFGAAFEISNLGRMVGWCVDPRANSVLPWTGRLGVGYQLLPIVPGGGVHIAYAVNACGTAVGFSGVEAVVWTRINTTGPSGAPVCDQ